MKIIFLNLLIIALISCQSSFKSDFDNLIMNVSKQLAENKNNLSRQVKIGSDGLKDIEQFLMQSKIQNNDEIQYFLKYYFSLYHYVKDDNKDRDLFLLKFYKNKNLSKEQSKFAKEFASILIKEIDDENKLRDKLNIGQVFEAFPKGMKDINGKEVDLNKLKNKIVLIDFWATWCMPCIKELPNVQRTYEQFKNKNFVIISISLDNEKEKFEKFLKTEKMDWIHIFDGKGWDAELANQYGIKSIPATFLLKENKIIAKDLRGDELYNKIAELLD